MKKKKEYKEFISRTLKALDHYKQYVPKHEQSYDRTLFMNACLGLLILPQQELYDDLPTDISAADWGFPTDLISVGNEKVDVREVTRHLRNAIAHNRIDFECHEGPTMPIGDITFVDKFEDKDYGGKGKENFRVVIPFERFKYFVLEFAKHITNDEMA